VHSNRHFKGCFQNAFRAGSICSSQVSIFEFPFCAFQIDTSRNLKSHLNHCKQSASSFSDRQSFGRINFRFVSPLHHYPDQVDVKLAASEPPSRSSNLRSMLYSLYSSRHSHFAAGEIR
jgi:hypothetical protein